jgi:hypothetical protein
MLWDSLVVYGSPSLFNWQYFIRSWSFNLHRLYYSTRMKSEAGPPHVIGSPNLPHDSQVKVTLAARPSRELCTSCVGAKMVCSWAECVFILEHYFATESFGTVHEAFSNMYPDKKVPNKTTIHRLVTKSWDAGSVCDRKHAWHWTVFTVETLQCGRKLKGLLVSTWWADSPHYKHNCFTARVLW